jgi:glycosyltransferase involved in cell wall biosynthesis
VNHLLVVTYVLDEDHPVLAWQIDVVRELARRVPRLTVLTEARGVGDLPANVRVLQLPHRPLGVPRRLGGGFLAASGVLAALKKDRPDACFVHMASEWLYRLGWVLKLLRVPVVLWYAHGTVGPRLRVAVLFADTVLTSSSEGFRIRTAKKRVIGQGVDVAAMTSVDPAPDGDVLLYVGRISARKQVDLLVDVLLEARTVAPDDPIRLRLVGPTVTAADKNYAAALTERIRLAGLDAAVELVGPVPRASIADAYADVFLHLSLSDTGSLDKSLLEALAAGTPILTGNIAFRSLLQDHPWMFLNDIDVSEVTRRVLAIRRRQFAYSPGTLRNLVVDGHDFDSYADRVMTQIDEVLAARAHRSGAAA